MKILKNALFLALPLIVAACGSQVVDFPTDAGKGGADSAMGDAAVADADASHLDAASGDGATADASDANAANDANSDSSDAASLDAGSMDAGNADAPTVNDAGVSDATHDGNSADAGNGDAGNADAADAGATFADGGDAAIINGDAASTDAANADAASLDAGDAMSPRVVSTNPADGAANVSVSEVLAATFNVPMNPTTLNVNTFTLRAGADASIDSSIAGTVAYPDGGTIATFVPSANLAVNTLYTATVSTGAMDLFGHPLASDYVWDFRTGACAMAPVALGAADSFAVLAYSTITSTGPTSVTGDLGLWTGPSVTGFPPGTLIGNQYIADPTAAAAMGSLATAYGDAAGRSLCAVTVAGNIGGQTLTPGLYMSTSSLAVSSGNLTLDAQGDPDAVFIFQMATTLTVTPGLQVILSGGAKATNIFWQVGSSATLGTTSVFQGTIMAAASISLNTGATLNGRALASNGAVTMQSNTIVIPAK